MVERISHVGIAVEDLDAAIARYARLGFAVEHRWFQESDGMEAAELAAGEARVELMHPTRPESPVGKFLAKRGEGVHHVCYAVDDVAGALDEARARGLETIDAAPRPGGGGRTRVGFVHPKNLDGVLVEFEQPAPAEAEK